MARKKKVTEKSKKRQEWFSIEKHPVFVWLFATIVTVVLIELASRKSLVSLLSFIFVTPHLFLINFMLVLTSYSFMFVTKRWGLARVLAASLWGIIGLVDFILLLFRTTPFTFHDLGLISAAMQVMNHYVSGIGYVAIPVAILLIVLGIAFLCKKAPMRTDQVDYLKGALKVFACIALTVYFWAVGHHAGILPRNFSNIGQAYQDYGLSYCFINSAMSKGISKPDTYDTEVVDVIMQEGIVPEQESGEVDAEVAGETKTAELTKPAVPDQETQVALEEYESHVNVIFLQLESFFDLTQLNDVTLSEDPIPNYHRLFDNYSSGFVSVPSVGAGTANTEFEIITGMNLDFFGCGEYPYQTVLREQTCESMAYIFHNLGYASQAIHNNSAEFYSRNTVFSRLGFDRFTSLEYMYDTEFTPNGWVKDKILTGNILEAMRSTEKNDFIYTISVQGHGGYPMDDILEDPKITLTLKNEDEARKNQLTYYANEIYEMDLFVQELTEALNEFEEPCVLVMYGDHLPSLGIEDTELTEGNIFQTKYIIWSNFQMEKRNQDVEAYQLGAMVMQRLGIQEGIMFRYHQKYFAEEKPNETAYLDSMAVIEYDILYGDRMVYEGENPYLPTRLKMGVRPISITQAEFTEDGLTVSGENFNEYSILIINGRQYEPDEFSQGTLVLNKSDLGDELTVCVGQQDNYGKTILSTTKSITVVRPTAEAE